MTITAGSKWYDAERKEYTVDAVESHKFGDKLVPVVRFHCVQEDHILTVADFFKFLKPYLKEEVKVYY